MTILNHMLVAISCCSVQVADNMLLLVLGLWWGGLALVPFGGIWTGLGIVSTCAGALLFVGLR